MYRFVCIIFIIFFVSSCSSKVQEKLGFATIGPNEYEVSANHPLEMPPHYSLPESLSPLHQQQMKQIEPHQKQKSGIFKIFNKKKRHEDVAKDL